MSQISPEKTITKFVCCNSLLYGISHHNNNRFQQIQGSGARIVTNTRKYSHITPILQKLPVRQSIHFKILVTTYKSNNDMAPEYLCELVSIRKSSGKLWSSSQIIFPVPVSWFMCTYSCNTHFVE